MGKDCANSRSVGDGRKDSAPLLRGLDVERFAEKYGIRAGGGCFLVRLPDGASAIEIVIALREAGRGRKDCGRPGPTNVGVVLEVLGNQIAEQCARGGVNLDGV
jgi:hypothetical protein